MKIAIATDMSGLYLKDIIFKHLSQQGHEVSDLGQISYTSDPVFYFTGAANVARAIQTGEADKGFLICSNGAGMNMAANKHPGIYAAMSESVYSAGRFAKINGANVLVMGQEMVGAAMACAMCDEFLKYNSKREGKMFRGIVDIEKKNFREEV